MAKGMLIAIDGLDGSGKETQSTLLCERLTACGIKNRLISFPTYSDDSCALVKMYLGGRFGDDPATVNAYAASSFYAMDRYCSYMLDWKKDYESDTLIVANRYTSANLVHQMSKLPESEWKSFAEWLWSYEFEKLGLPAPTAVVYLCLPPTVSAALIQSRCDKTGAVKDIHEKNAAFLENSYRAALYAAENCGWHKIDCANGNGLRGIDDINKQLCAEVGRIIGTDIE